MDVVQLVVGVLHALLIVAELTLLVPLLYLALLSVAALFASHPGRQPDDFSGSLPRFAVLIPAHDEAPVIAGAVASVQALDYPADRRDILVVADNCTDETAAIARAAGATVYAHTDAEKRAKGYALAWLLEQLEVAGRRYDAYVVIDADTRVSANFLTRMAAALAAGAQVAQAQYRVLNSDDAWTAGIRAVAFALFNHLRPLGRSRFGWSAGLKGNGMCFSRAVIERFGWGSYSLTEDVEYHVRLIEAGISVVYVPDAVIAAEMPVNLAQARSQQTRWERGRLDLTRDYVVPLVRGFLRSGNAARLDAAMEILLPPLSLLIGAVCVCLAVGGLLRWWPGLALGVVLAALLALHGIIGAALAKLSVRAYLSLLRAPFFIAWKCWVYLAALFGRGGNPWVRTQRADPK
ncbi:MAG TPA: glycosyltransferase family 2 protein [Ktedonobacterales bacterium]|nr:glycosyltransferase family 2 protein [Ktedonobacterales bacterium]